MGSARAPARDDDRDGRGGPAGRPARAPHARAAAGWRPAVAATTRTGSCHGCGASSGWPGAHREVPGGDAGRVARALGGRGRSLRAGAAPRDVRGCPECGDRAGCVAGRRRGSLARDGRGGSAARRASAVAGGSRSRMVGSVGGSAVARSGAVPTDDGRAPPIPGVGQPAILGVDAFDLGTTDARPARHPAVRPGGGPRPDPCRDPGRRERLGRRRGNARGRARGRRPDRRPRPPRAPRAWGGAIVPAARAWWRTPRGVCDARPTGRRRVHRRGHPRRARSGRAVRPRPPRRIARRLLERAGFEIRPADADLRHADPGAIRRPPADRSSGDERARTARSDLGCGGAASPAWARSGRSGSGTSTGR